MSQFDRIDCAGIAPLRRDGICNDQFHMLCQAVLTLTPPEHPALDRMRLDDNATDESAMCMEALDVDLANLVDDVAANGGLR